MSPENRIWIPALWLESQSGQIFLCSSLGGNDFKRINLLIQKNINPFVFSETQASGSHHLF